MFLQKIKNYLNDGSIKTRLTLFYTISVFILFTLVAFFLYWETSNILYKANYQFLSDEVDTIQYIMNDTPDLVSLKKEVVDMPSEPEGSIYRYYIRILDDKNQVIMQTPGMEKIFSNIKIAPPTTKKVEKKQYGWYEGEEGTYLFIQSLLLLGTDNKIGTIQIMLDTTYQHTLIHDRKILIVSLLLGALFAFILGFLIAHKGIKSLYLLTETTKKITVTSLSQRIDPKSWPAELRVLGVAFNQMLDRIEKSFLQLKQFSADLAHELRTPIGNLIGETEIALSHQSSLSEYQQVLGSNLEELQRISQLIENILFLAHAENPQISIAKKLLNTQEEIAIVCAFYQNIADEKNIKITYAGEAAFSANSTMFRRMISNILSNSINYGVIGGHIHFVMSELNKQKIEIIVRDNGIGIAAEHLPKIIDRFYRIDFARTQNPGGSGLGLSIVQSIVDLHQGKMIVTSELNQGTTIHLTFPK